MYAGRFIAHRPSSRDCRAGSRQHDQTARLSRAEIEERKNSSPIVVGAEDDKPSTGGDAVTFGGDRVNISAGARFDR